MIRSIEVVDRASAATMPYAAAVALIAIATPGCTLAARPDLHALYLSFDTLAGELEAASLRLPQAMVAVPFASDHAVAIAGFVSRLQSESGSVDLRICESEGQVRSVTVARWLARRLGLPLREPASAATVTCCALMDNVLKRVSHAALEGSRQLPRAVDWAVLP
ncbi:MAG: hypothetical protein U5L05_01170 [Rubrivivax sp.]|nr:hypothetical protein [Rubrivivax sp.]